MIAVNMATPAKPGAPRHDAGSAADEIRVIVNWQ
jgi:hypothetical protein